jgi:hypothetical protein
MWVIRLLSPALLGTALLGCSATPQQDAADLLHVSCVQQPAAGRCRDPRPAYYYDYRSGSCRRFAEGVCDRAWPFPTRAACIERCGGR